jgi:hypothetical protein
MTAEPQETGKAKTGSARLAGSAGVAPAGGVGKGTGGRKIISPDTTICVSLSGVFVTDISLRATWPGCVAGPGVWAETHKISENKPPRAKKDRRMITPNWLGEMTLQLCFK